MANIRITFNKLIAKTSGCKETAVGSGLEKTSVLITNHDKGIVKRLLELFVCDAGDSFTQIFHDGSRVSGFAIIFDFGVTTYPNIQDAFSIGQDDLTLSRCIGHKYKPSSISIILDQVECRINSGSTRYRRRSGK
ncbi:expressed protein [Batrachochytrium dendrobatidis JAM81]|uniref:Expressed protein n=1 Tax=Batrachochytrium dendrobatidis (strain JAM81 / FGSC 10211) TaxID=684364 RepID=F4P0D8_BATDJ|nr:uncharacterized protein BATDEDRAFT_31623 [Batrachochytrium dendrobatidis JAM81]EGF81572.1 expressed protein [Batrachochytrium dendrobatidis JAM81]|eukprot:XP_006677971.1 expressed protein [Batrachochytrium dendrobatidis JAM81]